MRAVGDRTWAVAWLSLGLLSFCPRAVSAAEMTCADPGLSASARSAALAAEACAAGTEAKRSLTTCGLTQTQPIRIAVVEQAMHPSFGACLAVYDVRAGCLEITEPERIAPMLAGRDARADLPAEEVFDALILLAAGSHEPDDLARGFGAVVELKREMDEARRRRLVTLGFTHEEAAELSSLHTRNFM